MEFSKQPRAWPAPAAILLGAVLIVAAAPWDAPARRAVYYPTRTMGTYANAILVTADSAASAADARSENPPIPPTAWRRREKAAPAVAPTRRDRLG